MQSFVMQLLDRNLIVTPKNDLDHHNSSMLKEKIEREFINSNAKHIIFDLSNVNFIDSSGIGMIIGRYKQLTKSNGKVVIININEFLLPMFEISGLKKIINCFSSLQEALSFLK